MIARYVVRRLLQLIPVLILVSLAVFLLVRAIPGDPVLVMLGIDPDARARISEEQYRVLQHQIGLDRPIYVQYLNWADKIIHGDFGSSLASRRPIFEIIFERYPATLYLAVTALFVGHHHRGSRWRHRRDQAEHPPGLRRNGFCSWGRSHARFLARAHVDRSLQPETRMASRNWLREPF